ncbi:glycosyltransferase family 8 protein [Aerococcaceae bacterium zg-ZUI334]|uniref:glycosyltransferase family 8 protein n=1 Tax=Aerococcaceae bacterium zg-252 TaxID=2796928 RepID=UPI001B96D1DF|nr:glycosyltransferase family 8 protein [Aerococcaceae bacterium zg-ZUI334]
MVRKQNDTMNIVLAADYGYKVQVETVMKSILKFHTNVQFFLINKDYPKEWFLYINEKLNVFDSCIVDKKISSGLYQNYKTFEHISEATFYRYHIPELIEEDKVLYLDSDILIVNALSSLYDLDIEHTSLAAVNDFGLKNSFNAGVLLINNRKWREKNVMNRALDIHEKADVVLEFADQDVLNELFKKEWTAIPNKYNMQIFGGNIHLKRYNVPADTVIIHYTTSIKPWATYKKTIKARIRRLYRILYAYLSGREMRCPLRVAIKNRDTLPFEQEWHQLSQLQWEDFIENRNK